MSTATSPWSSAPDLIYQEEIGKGGFGVVYKAYADKKFGKPTYAIKKISVEKFKLNHYRHYNGVERWFLKLCNEIDALQKLNNDHVVKYYECWFEGPEAHIYNKGDLNQLPNESSCTSGAWDKSDNFFFIRMGYCNSDLRKWLKAKNSLEDRNIQEVHDIFKQILRGLKYIHKEGIVHRDLKPENIMIVEVKGSMTIQIGDFGLATLVEQSNNQNELSDSNTGGVGTRYYRSPEMDKRDNNCDFKTDIFSTGLVFIECLDPNLNDNEKRHGVFSKIQYGNFKFPERNQTRFPNEMELIKRMTERDKINRPGAKEALKYVKENVVIGSENSLMYELRNNMDISGSSQRTEVINRVDDDFSSSSSQDQSNSEDNSKGVESVSAVELTLKLIEEPHLVKNHLQIQHILDLSYSYFAPLERGSNTGTLPIYNFFIQAIQIWVGCNGKKATIGVLCSGLEKHRFSEAKEILMREYRTHTRVTTHR